MPSSVQYRNLLTLVQDHDVLWERPEMFRNPQRQSAETYNREGIERVRRQRLEWISALANKPRQSRAGRSYIAPS